MKFSISYKAQRLLTTLLVILIISFFGWLTHDVNSTKLPDSGVPAEFYASENRDDLRKTFLKGIESAQTSILLFVYTLTDPTIIQALKEKAEQGVSVSVIVDAKASPYAGAKLGKKIHLLSRLGIGLMHCKLLVVDHTLVWIGSANMTSDSLSMHNNLVLGIHSPELADLITTKASTLTQTGSTKSFSHQEFSIGGQHLEFWFLPDDAPQAIRRIKELIRSAKKTIHIAMFTWTRKDFAHEIERAINRGVDVQIVIDYNSGKGAGADIVKQLQADGADIRLSQGLALLHHKFMVVDDNILVNGSANWTKAAFGKNDDCFVVLNDLTREQKQKLEEEWLSLYQDSEPPNL